VTMLTDPPSTIPGLVSGQARHNGDREAVIDGARRISFGEFEAEMLAVGRATIAQGVGRGDRVAIWAPNSAGWLCAAAGVMASGAAIVPVSTRYRGGEAAHLIRTARVSLIVTVGAFLGNDYVGMLREADPELADVPTLILSGSSEHAGTISWEAFLGAGAEISEAEARKAIAAIQPDDPAYVLFTSGTTGRPKGAIMAHSHNLACAANVAEYWPVIEGDRMFIVLPFFHIFGLNAGFLACFTVGATCVLASVFDVPSSMQAIQDEQITVLPGPPTIFQGILDHADRPSYDLSSLRVGFIASTMVPVALLRRVLTDGLATTISTGYGLTEAGGTVALSPPTDPPELTAAWCGKLLPKVELKIISTDGEGRELGLDEAGEILVRSATVMHGYFDDPEGTAAAIDADSWLHTGDVGLINADGYIRITDRIKDMFIVGGFNAYPAEIESILGEHPAVGQVAVVGGPDERLGEVGVAFVIPAPGAVLEPEELIAWSRDRLANFKLPRHVEIVSELPLTPSMKVMKQPLRDAATRLLSREPEAASH
jgi:acyl-CoA synthetase (AMP-forming)/AMP-acid ligase II